MSGELDAALIAACTPAHIREVYKSYKIEKLDHLRAETLPTFADLLMSQGEPLEHVLALDDLVADYPAEDYVISEWGSQRSRHKLIQIPMGADGITYRMFEQNIAQIASQISRRIQGGRYIFYPFREVEVLKEPLEDGSQPRRAELIRASAAGQTRKLAIASIRDVIVQQILYRDVLRAPAEQLFRQLDEPLPVSYAYRPGKSPQQAAQAVLRYVRGGYTHVLDADLSKFFDSIPHDALLAKCQEWLDGNPLTLTLLRRFIRVHRIPFTSYAWDAHGRLLGPKIFQRVSPRQYGGEPRPGEPQRYSPGKGIPQGGVLSGLLANLYLHSFDCWLKSELAPELDLQYVRYADDFVVLARSKAAVCSAYESIRKKIESPIDSGGLGLAMHHLNPDNPSSPDSKTRYLHLPQSPLWFVGFEIAGAGRDAQLRIKPKNVESFVNRWARLLDSEKELIDTVPDPKERLKRVIQARLRPKILGYRWVERCEICGEQWLRSRSWISFYRCVTDWRQVLELDQRLRKMIYRYFRHVLPRLTRADLTEMGLPSLMREYRRARRMRCGCKCPSSVRNRRNFHKYAIRETGRSWTNNPD